MLLPPELRNRIFELVIPYHAPDTFDPFKEEPSIIRTSRALRAEASSLYYGNNSFRIQVTKCSQLPLAMQKCRSVVLRCGPRPFRGLEIRFAVKNTLLQDFRLLLPLAELIRELGFEPAREFHTGPNLLFNPHKARSLESAKTIVYGHDADAVARVITIGRRARDEKWSKAKLEVRFEDFVRLVQRKAGKLPAWV